MIKQRVFDASLDKKILIGLIVSTPFCKAVVPMLDIKFFPSGYMQRIARWIIRYFKKYGEAPTLQLQDIFYAEENKLKPEEAELIRMFLIGLSKQYEQETAALNIPYLLDRTTKHFKKRAIELLLEKAEHLVASDKVEDAENCVREYKKIAMATSNWLNPFDPAAVEAVFSTIEQQRLFHLPGKVGDVLGELCRGWLLCYCGPMKRGKTWFLQYLAIAALFMRLRVVFFSLEMSAAEVATRMYKQISGLADEDGWLTFPCFDCVLNQTGVCTKLERTNKLPLLNDLGQKPQYVATMVYKPCIYCREVGHSDYRVAYWFASYEVGKLSMQSAKTAATDFSAMFGQNLRVRAYPASSANSSDLKRDLDELEYIEEFIPDVIVVDYADILAVEDERLEGRERINRTWEMLKNLAQTRYSLVATASQSNRKSLEKRNVDVMDTAEEIRKLAHVDIWCTLNQTEEEKYHGVMRIRVLEHRHRCFARNRQILVLQQLEVGNPIIDSELLCMYKGDVPPT